jgi:hypothetical protein
MIATTRFFKVSFLIGAHAAAAAWGFWAFKLFIDGNFGWALVFGMLAGINAMALAIWWSNRLPRDEGVQDQYRENGCKEEALWGVISGFGAAGGAVLPNNPPRTIVSASKV